MEKLLAILGIKLGKKLFIKLATKLIAWKIKRTENLIDDALQSICTKVKDGTIAELGIDVELDMLASEFTRLTAKKAAKQAGKSATKATKAAK